MLPKLPSDKLLDSPCASPKHSYPLNFPPVRFPFPRSPIRLDLQHGQILLDDLLEVRVFLGRIRIVESHYELTLQGWILKLENPHHFGFTCATFVYLRGYIDNAVIINVSGTHVLTEQSPHNHGFTPISIVDSPEAFQGILFEAKWEPASLPFRPLLIYRLHSPGTSADNTGWVRQPSRARCADNCNHSCYFCET